ncbi:hypothetical protein LTR70_005019 [Exophiala xenobiotica]|uniref:Uncharacterized protein n=1 Tax=Lithohypha guttulata TaxID=1690604 RepID=A0ABR0KDM8_9EURO|nr:hypothetical protein LTR24_004423 [Lithohypha guttulata]KAK5319400.1 hypothetical protein LTR70_005019 [Exophiala xenobiotica]
MQLLLIISSFALSSVMGGFSDVGPYPASYAVFSSAFKQPPIPDVTTEFRGHFIQHKWDENVSHIASGYWYNSAAHGKVRVDETYDGAFGSSLFDYTDVDANGQVLNKLWTVETSVGNVPACFVEHVADAGFPLITADLLKIYQASFGGVVNDPYVGYVQSWNFLYGSSIPIIAYLDQENVVMGLDFWGAERRTKVVNRFFNNVVGEIDAKVFEEFPCP